MRSEMFAQLDRNEHYREKYIQGRGRTENYDRTPFHWVSLRSVHLTEMEWEWEQRRRRLAAERKKKERERKRSEARARIFEAAQSARVA